AVFPFGDELHYSDLRLDLTRVAIAAELRAYARSHGFADVEVTPIRAGIEDAFMALMDTTGSAAA
ncbi:MAG: hypothetical protein ACRELT_12560, partial [Longimicrobiales bacterium]